MKRKYFGHANKSGVYKIVNTINGRLYIGSCKLFKGRAREHLKALQTNTHSNTFLQHDFNKCGEDVFEFHVIEVVPGEQKNRLLVEQKFIDEHYDKQNQCYNFNPKTNNESRSCFSKSPEETRKKLSEASKKRWKDKEYRERITKTRKEIWQDPEHRKLQSKKRKEVWKNKERQEAHQKQMEDYWSKEENKEKYAKKIKSYWADEEWRQKVIDRRKDNEKVMESFYRNCHSKETFEKIAKANTKNHGKLISSDGKIVEVIGLRNFCEQHDLNPKSAMANISKILKGQGRIKSYKGWRKYEE